MRVVFRTDASLAIGSGHVMRCLSLAGTIRRAGAEVSFVCRSLPGNLCDYIADQGYLVYRLPASGADIASGTAGEPVHAAWLAVSWQLDAEQTLCILPQGVDWLVVDHYALDARWEGLLRQKAKQVMVIDDLADRLHDCDLLLDQNLSADAEDRYDGLLPARCQRLIGPRHALLRPEFAAMHGTGRSRDGQIKRLLIFFGGVDACNETGKALTALAQIPDAGWQVDVVVGATNPHRQELEARCAARAGYTFHCQTPAMPRLMAQADLALGAGGTAQLERCAAGLPSLLLCLADNQLAGCKAMAADGSALYLGPAGENTAADLAAALRFCLRSPELLRHVGQQAGRLVDGLGGVRVVAAMGLERIVLREATPDDSLQLWQWRNHERTRHYSGNPNEIPWADHTRWYAATLANPARVLLIGSDAQGPVGVLRYDLSDGAATISVYLVPERQGQGLGRRLIEAGSAWLRQYRPRVVVVRAEIHPENLASLKAFRQAGFIGQAMCFVKEFQEFSA